MRTSHKNINIYLRKNCLNSSIYVYIYIYISIGEGIFCWNMYILRLAATSPWPTTVDPFKGSFKDPYRASSMIGHGKVVANPKI